MQIKNVELEIRDPQILNLVAGAKILSVQEHCNKIVLSILGDWPEENFETRAFRVMSPEYQFDPEPLTFMGTVQISGQLWHIFEEK